MAPYTADILYNLVLPVGNKYCLAILPAKGFIIIKTENKGIKLFTNSNLGPKNHGINFS